MPKQEDYDDILDLLEEGEIDGDDTAAAAAAAAGDDDIDLDDEGADGEIDDTPDSDDEEGEEEGAGDDTQAGGAGDEAAGDDEIPEGQHPASVIQQPKPEDNPFGVPANAKERMAEIKAALEKVKADWAVAEINETEFEQRISELNAESADIAARVRADDLWRQQAAAAAQQADDRLWDGAVKTFKAANPDLWSDQHRKRFNEHVKSVTGDPRYSDMSYEQKLTLAGSFYASERQALTGDNITIKRPSTTPKAAKAGKAGNPSNLEQRPPLPPTLGKRPAAAPNDNSDGMFAAINRMDEAGDVEGSEEALMRMSPEMREKWLQGA